MPQITNLRLNPIKIFLDNLGKGVYPTAQVYTTENKDVLLRVDVPLEDGEYYHYQSTFLDEEYEHLIRTSRDGRSVFGVIATKHGTIYADWEIKKDDESYYWINDDALNDTLRIDWFENGNLNHYSVRENTIEWVVFDNDDNIIVNATLENGIYPYIRSGAVNAQS